jgi:hypothetical protein
MAFSTKSNEEKPRANLDDDPKEIIIVPAEVNWDQKASATFHTKKSKKPKKFLQKALF